MTPDLLEYIVLRLARRFLFSDRLLRRVGRFVPYYRTNANEVDARPVVETYRRLLAASGTALPAHPVILEIGSGATNSVGYALAASDLAGAGGRIFLFEPYVELDEDMDRAQRAALPADVAARVRRIASLREIEPGSVDLVLSHSVLEHVRDPEATLADIGRAMGPSGVMLHVVDYRDHFFKYPFHFLLFSRRSWDRWLDPGDLPRWRLGDHLRQLSAAGFRAQVLESRSLPEEFARVAARIHPDFDRADEAIAVTHAALLVSRAS
jgi:SAM-dependent methyltransferase